MDKAKVKRIAVSTAAVASVLLGATVANAQDARLKSIVDEVNQANQIAQASQQRIDQTADATSKLYGEFKTVLKTNAGLRAYNAQQRRVIAKQEEEIEKIKNSIGQIDEIKRQIIPLMEDMVADLDDFIKLDIPFQLEERQERVERLRDVIDDPNVSDPERFRVILEAYKAEVQYGRTRNAYEGLLEDGRSVNFVRIGRVGFYYQTKDASETAAWDQEAKQWVPLDASYSTAVKQLIKMARGQVPVDVLNLPIKAPVQKGR
jgi:methyl-accepting chemotaxis protein